MNIPDEFQELESFFCPAEFWPAFGYEGAARFVGIYWEPAGDEASYHDGRMGFVGADWPAYTALINHNFELMDPRKWLLGSSEEEGTHWLVIDRDVGRAYMARRDVAHAFLKTQWPPVSMDGLDAEAFVEAFANVVLRPVSAEEIGARLAESKRLYRELVEALRKAESN